MSDKEETSLQSILDYSFRDVTFLTEALTHKSFLNEIKGCSSRDNERLEFLGDAVLDLIISEYLTQEFPTFKEGELCKRRAMIVSEPFLARIAQNLDLGVYIKLGRGEELTGGRKKNSILANTLEAIIAALYLDGGLEPARSFILKSFDLKNAQSFLLETSVDYKTQLQELSQKGFDVLPNYKLLKESGPEHSKKFEVLLSIKGTQYGRGSGRSKKEAEQQAAKQALEHLKTIVD